MDATANRYYTNTGRRMDALLTVYESSHRNPRNELIHLFAIPAIMLSLFGLLHALHPWACYALIALGAVYYFFVASWAYQFVMLLWVAVAYALVLAMGEHVLPISAGIFIIAWVFQFIGHRIEGKKPSFFEDIQYLLVGPLFVLATLHIKLRP